MIKTLFHWRKRPLVYSLIIAIGLLILQYILDHESPEFFMWGTLILGLMFMLELISTIYIGKKFLIQYKLPPIDGSGHIANILHHIVLPIALLISLAGFLFFNKEGNLKFIIIGVGTLLFWILFTNIFAFYEDKFKIELRTHYIYDYISVFAFFSLFDTTVQATAYLGVNMGTKLILIALVALVFSLISIIRLGAFDLLKLSIPFALMSCGLYALTAHFNLPDLKIAFLNTILYYFLVAFSIHHKEHTKSMKVLEEYIVLVLIAIVLIIFN